MAAGDYDVFVSYRREDGSHLARIVRDGLSKRGLKVYLDVEGLSPGRFDVALLRRIEEAPDFVLLLTPRALDRAADPDDWVAREVVHAIATNRNVVPLATTDFKFPAAAALPPEVQILSRLQWVTYDHRFSDESIGRLHGMLRSGGASKRARLQRIRGVAAAVVLLALGGLAAWTWSSWSGADRAEPVGSSPALAFEQARPSGSSTIPRLEAGYRLSGGGTPLPQISTGDAVLGVTILRLRRAVDGDDKRVRLLVQEDSGLSATEWTPVRVASDQTLREGDRVRLTVESLRHGYLYVIDREQYTDGSLGDPYLIFPTLRTRGGDNAVAAGRLMEIPDWQDTPPYFTLRRSRPDHAGELLVLIVAREPLPDLAISRGPLKLTIDQLARWERDWGARVQQVDMVGGEGTVYTLAERQAGADGTRLLTQAEPFPQTIYRVAAKPGDPLLVKVPLTIAK